MKSPFVKIAMINNRESVLRAIEKCDRLGRTVFLKEYGFNPAKSYHLIHNGKEYDSKAIVGVAYGFENPDHGPLRAEEFSGGAATVQNWLEDLGFQVRVAAPVIANTQAYIVTWNPERWTWGDYEEDVAKSQSGEVLSERWSTGNTLSIQPGDRVFLYRQSIDRGIIGSGHATSEVYQGPHWDGSDREANFVKIDYDQLLAVSEVFPVEELKEVIPEIVWDRIQACMSVPIKSVVGLEDIWQAHLARLNRIVSLPDEIIEPQRYDEGAVKRISVNSYERNPEARRKCIEHFGLNCAVCGFNFGATYGELGEGYIHVHHLRDLASIGEEYEVNPITDLRPVCPNCHAMLHRPATTMSIEELQRTIANVS